MASKSSDRINVRHGISRLSLVIRHRASALRAGVVAVTTVGTTAALTSVAPPPSQADSGFGLDRGRPFVADSAFTRQLPTARVPDPNSAGIVDNLSSPGGQIANVYEFGIPVYYADEFTPRKNVNCTKDWGQCALEEGPVPLTEAMVPHPGSDMAMVVIDWSTRRSYEFWQYKWNGGNPTTSWGDYADVDEEGNHVGSTGAGISRLAGVVRTYEVRQGYIDHPLVFSTKFCQGPYGGGNFRYPATKTDGQWSGSAAMPEGGKIQLDPSIDIEAIAGITPLEKMVGTALQEYGAYAIDCGAAPIAFSFESPLGESDPYPEAGLPWDYWHMPHIPWDSIQVLKHWHGGSELETLPPLDTPPDDTIAPTAAVTSPTDDVLLGGTVTVAATANDDVGVARVDFLVDSTVRSSDATSPYEMTLDTTTLVDGEHTLTVTAHDGAGNVGTSPTVHVHVDNDEVSPPPTGTGLPGTYFNRKNFASEKFDRIDPTIDFDWGYGSPGTDMAPNTYSIRWSGKVQSERSEEYTFITESDDGVRLWVDGQLLIDNWTMHSPTIDSGRITLQADQMYDIVLEYFEHKSGALMKLAWSSPSTPLAIVPATRLYAS